MKSECMLVILTLYNQFKMIYEWNDRILTEAQNKTVKAELESMNFIRKCKML